MGRLSIVRGCLDCFQEDFISGSEKLNYLKDLKASYGKNGNQGLDPYQTLARVGPVVMMWPFAMIW